MNQISSLKINAAKVINLSLKNRVDVLKLDGFIPWELIKILWETWLSDNFNALKSYHPEIQELSYFEPKRFDDPFTKTSLIEIFCRNWIFNNDETDILCVWKFCYKGWLQEEICIDCLNGYNKFIRINNDFLSAKGFKRIFKRRIMDHDDVDFESFSALIKNQRNWCSFCLKRANFRLIPRRLCCHRIHELIGEEYWQEGLRIFYEGD